MQEEVQEASSAGGGPGSKQCRRRSRKQAVQEGTLGSGSKRSRRRGQHGKVNACLEKGLVLFEQFLGLNSEFWEANQNSSM